MHQRAGRAGGAGPNTPATSAFAQRILVTAVSGCSPNSCATLAAQPRSPRALVAASIAC